jgi:hypothetical protein
MLGIVAKKSGNAEATIAPDDAQEARRPAIHHF